jgi:hypothetical protein
MQNGLQWRNIHIRCDQNMASDSQVETCQQNERQLWFTLCAFTLRVLCKQRTISTKKIWCLSSPEVKNGSSFTSIYYGNKRTWLPVNDIDSYLIIRKILGFILNFWYSYAGGKVKLTYTRHLFSKVAYTTNGVPWFYSKQSRCLHSLIVRLREAYLYH